MKQAILNDDLFSQRACREVLSEVVTGQPISVGEGFSATNFHHSQFFGKMDPLIMVDHYVMSTPTFGAHAHAGLSAVTLLFEDSIGQFHNRDSLGSDFDLLPGELYWLNAGSGVMHDEYPRAGSHAHGLQIFVNMPNSERSRIPTSTLVRVKDIPIIEDSKKRIRVVLGDWKGINGGVIENQPTTLLDTKLACGGGFTFEPKQDTHTWIYAVSGNAELHLPGERVRLEQGSSVSLNSASKSILVSNHDENHDEAEAHIVLLSSKAIREPFLQQGPFAMKDEHAIHQAQRRYRAGDFGKII